MPGRSGRLAKKKEFGENRGLAEWGSVRVQ